eukprot:TRINITY_DN9535_c0_g1_i1.p1 TRINITY_DN9535_c0_g1~~TRINITY_DN9535_c0_g1_i1.p1  ORF type:complete len:570 (+),score=132.29 TRINITY_DN9535_c0_g1_i1:64-1773(+)
MANNPDFNDCLNYYQIVSNLLAFRLIAIYPKHVAFFTFKKALSVPCLYDFLSHLVEVDPAIKNIFTGIETFANIMKKLVKPSKARKDKSIVEVWRRQIKTVLNKFSLGSNEVLTDLRKCHVISSTLNYAKFPEDVFFNTMQMYIPNCIVDIHMNNFTSVAINVDDVTIRYLSTEYCELGGITSPTKFHIKGSNGKIYPFILKNEDLTVSSVIYDFFNYVNNILASNGFPAKHTLKTYKIVPIPTSASTKSSSSNTSIGYIEWISGTIALRNYILLSNVESTALSKVKDRAKAREHLEFLGAHLRYFPNDLSTVEAHTIFDKSITTNFGPNFGNKLKNFEFDSETEGLASHLETFQNIKKKFNPVLGFWFSEQAFARGSHFEHSSRLFFELKNNFLISCAVNSIVGHIVGLGDRHLSNILIMENTGSIVNIDLELLFDDAKVLQIPEKVPFRLTSNIIHALGGVSVLNSKFKAEMTKIYRIMVNNGVPLIAICESIIQSNLGRSFGDDNEENSLADRALSLVNKKLFFGQFSVPSSALKDETYNYISELINQATDDRNLCLMFKGWSPWV